MTSKNTKHLFFINNLTDLIVKKDSTLAIIAALKDIGHEVYLLFQDDFYYQNTLEVTFKMYDFNYKWDTSKLYLEDFTLKDFSKVKINENFLVHLRLDPPFDLRYLRYCWMWDSLEKIIGFKTTNKASEILKNNEKLLAYNSPDSCPTLITSNFESFTKFINDLSATEVVCKPVDLYQGIGVVKLDTKLKSLESKFHELVKEYDGPIVVQPFLENVKKGELRIVYFNNIYIGAIKKIPKEGGFISNIAFGATYHDYQPSKIELDLCERYSGDLYKDGLNFLAFDILDNQIQEINVTCPGLIVELSKASGQNKALEIANLLN